MDGRILSTFIGLAAFVIWVVGEGPRSPFLLFLAIALAVAVHWVADRLDGQPRPPWRLRIADTVLPMLAIAVLAWGTYGRLYPREYEIREQKMIQAVAPEATPRVNSRQYYETFDDQADADEIARLRLELEAVEGLNNDLMLENDELRESLQRCAGELHATKARNATLEAENDDLRGQ